MTAFEGIHVHGFRRLYDVNLRLKPLNVMIGANSSGKTTILDVFTLLAASASGDLAETISHFGGVDGNLTNLSIANAGKARFMSFELGMPVSEQNPIDYRITLSQQGAGYEISDETLSQQRTPSPPPFKHIESHRGNVRYFVPQDGLQPPTWDYNQGESALSQVPKMFQEPEDFRKRLASSTHSTCWTYHSERPCDSLNRCGTQSCPVTTEKTSCRVCTRCARLIPMRSRPLGIACGPDSRALSG